MADFMIRDPHENEYKFFFNPTEKSLEMGYLICDTGEVSENPFQNCGFIMDGSLKDPMFYVYKAAVEELEKFLRMSNVFPILKSKEDMEHFCHNCSDCRLKNTEQENYGFVASNNEYVFFIRCSPNENSDDNYEYDIYLYDRDRLTDLGIEDSDRSRI